MRIYVNLCDLFDLFESNICESIIFDKNRLFHIQIDRINSNRSNIFNLFDRNMPFRIRIYPYIFAIRIYANICEYQIYSNFMQIGDHA